MSQRPPCREDFEVAIICALPLEYDAVALLFDEFWDKDGDAFGRAVGDFNTYTTGRIGKHDVVLALLSHMGKANAAAAAANMRSSYRALRLVILAGICGGVPCNNSQGEIFLGDVVISKSIIQYDFGRKYPDGFIRKNTDEDNLSKHDKNIRNFLAIFDTSSGQNKLQERTAYFLSQLQEKAERHQKYTYPGKDNDKLFKSSYRHKHRNSAACICNSHGRKDPVCDEALGSSCDDLGCRGDYLVVRKRLKEQDIYKQDNMKAPQPAIYLGAVASGDTVMKSGEDRDRIAKRENVIAFEMEAAGIWEEMPCIVVKGVCDYADCHKNKLWQDFAAATAASASKALLERYVQTDRRLGQSVPPRPHFLVPFGRNKNFIGRETILSELLDKTQPDANKNDCQRIAINGLGGVGKTQIALEAVYLLHDRHPDCSIFWVPAVNATGFENAYRDIGKQLKIDENEADIKQLVKAALSEESSGSWLLVIDNADDADLLFGVTGLLSHLPFSRKGSILFTTRNYEVAVRLDILPKSIFNITEMAESEALSMLQTGLQESQTSNLEATKKLLNILANLPLAIRQASAYMAMKHISTLDYLELCESEPKDMIDLLSRDFEDRHRYKEAQNPVATTWLISFSQIIQHNQLAAEYLKYMSILAEKDVLKSLLPIATKIKAIDALGILQAYAFITQREGDSFDMHRLVRLAMRNWLEKEGELKEYVTSAIQRLIEVVPFPEEYSDRDIWMRCLPHAQAVLELPEYLTDKEAEEANLLTKVAVGNRLLGRYQVAEQMNRRALELKEKVFGKDHLSTLNTMKNLAVVLSHLGRYKEAEKMHRQTLELKEEMLGKSHPLTLDSMNNLANALSDLGRYDEAERMHQQTLKLREEMHGKGHLLTLKSMNNVAFMFSRLGRYNKAEEMHQQILELKEEVFGKDHLSTLDSMNNLGNAFSDLGRYEEAEEMHQQIFKLREEMLGKKHPLTLDSMNNIAKAFSDLGRYEEAEKMHQQTLKLREEVLGKKHPLTLTSTSNLANALSNLGRYEEAEKMQKQILQLKEEVLGKNHPSTLTSISNLANTLSDLGKYEEAEKMHQQVFRLREEVLGKDHPLTLDSMNNFGYALADLSRFEEAEQIYQQILELKEKAFGKKHPSTLNGMNNLGGVLFRAGRYEEAEKMHQQTLELREEVLGKDHPSTQQSRINIASCQREMSKQGVIANTSRDQQRPERRLRKWTRDLWRRKTPEE